MSNFRIGQKVVCVDDKPSELMGDSLKKGAVYTVCKLHSYVDGLGHYGVELEEAKSGSPLGPAYRNTRFKPAVTLSEDIDLFKAISEDSLGRLEVLEEELNRT